MAKEQNARYAQKMIFIFLSFKVKETFNDLELFLEIKSSTDAIFEST